MYQFASCILWLTKYHKHFLTCFQAVSFIVTGIPSLGQGNAGQEEVTGSERKRNFLHELQIVDSREVCSQMAWVLQLENYKEGKRKG